MSLTKQDLQQIGTIVDASIIQTIDTLVTPQFDRMYVRLEAIEARLSAVEKRLDAVEQRLDRVEKRLDIVEQRLDGIESQIVLMGREISDVRRVTQRLSKQELHNQVELKEQDRRVQLLQHQVAELEKAILLQE